MSTTPQTVVVQPGGHLKLQGQGKGTTTVQVAQPTTPPPAVNVTNDVPGQSLWPIIITAIATLTAAFLGQVAAHHFTRSRERHKANRAQLDAAIDAWATAADEMTTMAAAFLYASNSKKPERMYEQALVYHTANVAARKAGRRYRSFPDADRTATDLLKRLDDLGLMTLTLTPEHSDFKGMEKAGQAFGKAAHETQSYIARLSASTAHR